MKITIIGTHSTGKTTILTRLFARLQGYGAKVYIVPEMARLCPYPINETSTIEAQEWILNAHIEAEKQAENAYDIVLCDRATIDNFAYFLKAIERTACVLPNNKWEQMAVAHAHTYTYIFKTQKISLFAKPDAQRTTNEEFRNEIDQTIARLLEKNAFAHTLLPPTFDYEEHVNFILRHTGVLDLSPNSISAEIAKFWSKSFQNFST
ncbi:MAG: ATP-binding protein [Candidatus Magasanikbacteria bacterium]|nr:ATP-binding protein [Candidatus Magasanikbacteria bacterium]